MRALVLNCTLKPSPEESNTEALARAVIEALEEHEVVATPTWLRRPSSVAQRVLERMDAMLSEQDDEGRTLAYNRVAGVVVTGNEDGAHHVISEISGGLIDIGYTVPGHAWTYWNRGPGRFGRPRPLQDPRQPLHQRRVACRHRMGAHREVEAVAAREGHRAAALGDDQLPRGHVHGAHGT